MNVHLKPVLIASQQVVARSDPSFIELKVSRLRYFKLLQISVRENDSLTLCCQPGQSFSAVVGTGGMGGSDPKPEMTSNPWWAATG